MSNHQSILLGLMPFWTSFIPPLGISCLKSFLMERGIQTHTVDANSEERFRNNYHQYFDTLQAFIPKDKRGNFYNIGNDVLRNHMMAHLHYTNENDYWELIRLLIKQTFFISAESKQIQQLNQNIERFYQHLKSYLIDLMSQYSPEVLGLSVFNGNLPASLFAFRLIKERYPHVQTIMGGGVFADQLHPQSPNFKRFIAQTPYIDQLVIGEGEQLLFKILRGDFPNSQRIFTIKDIQGEVLDLAAVKIPDFSDFDVHQYTNIAAYVSRSCPYQCSFCSETVQWGKYRKKKAHQIVEELITLSKQYGCQLFLLADSLLNPVIESLTNELSKREDVVYWDGYLRADKHVCNIDHTLQWRRSGFYRARLGVESGSSKILELMGKKITPLQIKEAIANLANAGIKTTTYWVVGHPGETEQDFRQTLELIQKLKDDIYEAECNPFNLYFSGQIDSEKWKLKSCPLYPQNTEDMLITQTWILEDDPSREEIFSRIRRFVEHCNKLGIPNPYSWKEIQEADERWKKLKKNAVPSMWEFKKKNSYINECKNVKKLLQASNVLKHDDQWGF